MNKNIKIAKELVKLAKSLVAVDGWNNNEIKFCHNQFEKDMIDSNDENGKPFDESTRKKCLDAFDKLFEDLKENSSPGALNVHNLCDRFNEKCNGAPKECYDLLFSLFSDEARQLGLKG